MCLIRLKKDFLVQQGCGARHAAMGVELDLLSNLFHAPGLVVRVDAALLRCQYFLHAYTARMLDVFAVVYMERMCLLLPARCVCAVMLLADIFMSHICAIISCSIISVEISY